jgi:uncharacterized membrane protein HdeD (DUF308 family)
VVTSIRTDRYRSESRPAGRTDRRSAIAHIGANFFFVAEGIASVLYALEHRRELSGRWEWMLISGIIDLILAGIIFAGFPGTAAWALGLLVGVNMILGGVALVAIAVHARSAARAV